MSFLLISLLVCTAISVGGLIYVFASIFSDSSANYNSVYEHELSRKLEDLFLFIPAKKILDLSRALAAVGFLLFAAPLFRISQPILLLTGLFLGFAAAYGGFILPKWYIGILKRKRLKRFNLQLLNALGSLSNALRAGFSITQAFETVANSGEEPISQEFCLFLQQQRIGVGFSDALQNLEKRVGSEDLTLVCNSIEIARKTGGNLTEIFDSIALTIRDRMRIEMRIQTLTAQGKMQAWIIGSMPFLLAIGMTIFKPQIMLPFLFSIQGIIVIAIVILMVLVGVKIIKKIITIDI